MGGVAKGEKNGGVFRIRRVLKDLKEPTLKRKTRYIWPKPPEANQVGKRRGKERGKTLFSSSTSILVSHVILNHR